MRLQRQEQGVKLLLTAMLSVSAGSTIVAVNFYFSQITDKQYLITGITTVLLSAVIFVVFDIMLNLSFKALKKDWKYGLVHVALAVAVMLSLYTGFFGYSSRVPDTDSIESASVSARTYFSEATAQEQTSSNSIQTPATISPSTRTETRLA